MAYSCSRRRSSRRPAASSYEPPTLLQDLHILDFLELTGSQAKAGAALAMHQSTVCRSLQLMRREFHLAERKGKATVGLHSSNDCLEYLRLAYRAHRLMEGLLRIGTDGLHQSLLNGLVGVQPVPPRFRSGGHWAELVRHGLLDGAIVSSFGLEQPLRAGQHPHWEGVIALPLGSLALQLMAARPDPRPVLLPSMAAAPLLHQSVARHGLESETQPAACQEPRAWLKRARDRGLALPLCPALLTGSWLEANQLVPLDGLPPLIEQLWLLLPQRDVESRPVRQCLRRLRFQIRRAQIMQNLHEFRPEPALQGGIKSAVGPVGSPSDPSGCQLRSRGG